MPSIIPLMRYCASRPRLIGSRGETRRRRSLSSELALAGGVLAVLPGHPFPILNDVFGDQCHGVLPVVVERDLTYDRVSVFDLRKLGDDLPAIRTDLLDGVHQQVRGRVGKRTVGLGRGAVLLLGIFFGEELSAWELFQRRALAKCERALRERTQPLDEIVGQDPRGSLKLSGDAELVHLRPNAN